MRLIFLNGWSASVALLGELPERLSEKHELIVLDHVYQYSPEEMRRKIEALLSDETVLLGWSLGGMLAMQMLIAQSSFSAKLRALIVLQAPPCFINKADWSYGIAESAFEELEVVLASCNGQKLSRIFTHLMVAGSTEPSEERRRIKLHYSAETLPAWPVLEQGLRYLKELDLRRALSQLQLPVYGLYGANDALIKPEGMSFLGEHCPDFHGEVIPDMGHFPYGHFTETVAKKILVYLDAIKKERFP